MVALPAGGLRVDEVVADLALIAAFGVWQERRALSQSTIRHYRSTLQGLLATLDGQGLAGVTRDDVEAFLATRNITERGRYHYLSHISNWYKWAIEEGHAATDPTSRIPRPRLRQNLPRPIPEGQLQLALTTTNPRLKAWLCLGAYGGLRCKEIANLRADDLHWHQDPPVLVVSAPKGRRQRAVPMHDRIEQSLRVYGVPRDGYVFRRWDTNQPIGAYTVSHEIAKYFRELGIPATAHMLRHTFATNVYAASKDLRMTQDLMGHADPSSTAIYTQLAPGASAEIVRGL